MAKSNIKISCIKMSFTPKNTDEFLYNLSKKKHFPDLPLFKASQESVHMQWHLKKDNF